MREVPTGERDGMTNTRITATQVVEWEFCPWCGQRLQLDQDLDALVLVDGDVDVVRSIDNGFDPDKSVKSCGHHIRLWVPEFGDEAEFDG